MVRDNKEHCNEMMFDNIRRRLDGKTFDIARDEDNLKFRKLSTSEKWKAGWRLQAAASKHTAKRNLTKVAGKPRQPPET
jgi:hypothetical protein